LEWLPEIHIEEKPDEIAAEPEQVPQLAGIS
jgi:hypothetical protein